MTSTQFQELRSGAFVHLISNPNDTYQVVSVDEHSDTCWVRRWPLSNNGSPPFGVSQEQLIAIDLDPSN